MGFVVDPTRQVYGNWIFGWLDGQATMKKDDTMALGSTLIQEIVAAGNPAIVSFTAIPATFRHLLLVCAVRSTFAGADSLVCQFNGDNAANYDSERLSAAAAAASAAETLANANAIAIGIANGNSPANVADLVEIMIGDYRGITWQKPVLLRATTKNTVASGGVQTVVRSGWWRNTAAINQIDLKAANIATGSVFSLYGLG